MTKTPISLQDLRRRLYIKAKTEPSWRFWGLYVHVCKPETLREAYLVAKANDGAPGIDGVTFAAVEAGGVQEFLDQLRKELVERTYRPQAARKVEIPKGGGKMRQLSIPSIRDRVVQGALKLILEPIFEADFQPGSFGYRPKKSAHTAIQRVIEKQFLRARPMSLILICAPTSTRCGIISCSRRWRGGLMMMRFCGYSNCCWTRQESRAFRKAG